MIAGSDSLDPSRGHRALRITLVLLLLAAALAPLLHLVISLVANYYAVPYYDSWNFFYRLAKFLNGESSLGSYLFSQQNEARPAFPRLLLLLVHSVSRSLTIDVLLNVASAVGSAVVTLLLLRKTNPILRWPALLAVAIFFNLNFFSIAQWQNWNWRNQLILLLPNFFFALGWLVNLSRLPPLLRGLLVSLCCAASTFSFANGLFQWFLLVPLAFGLARKEKIRLWSLHAAAALLCIAVYFTGYERPEGHDPSAALAYPGRVVVYFSAWLGSSLSAGSQPVAEVWGVILFVTFLFLCWQCYVRWRAEGLQAGWLPWISMGCYALISGGVTALGRSHIGLEQALRPRYCSISQWLIVGILGLGATLLQQSWTRKPAQARATGGLLLLLAAGFLYFQARHTLQAGEEWHKFAERMHFQKQAFGLEAAQPGQLWSFDQSDRNAVLDTYKEMRKAGFLADAFHSDQILAMLATRTSGRWSDGEVQYSTCLPFRDIRCRGWAVGGEATAGNRVLIVLITPGKVRKVLAVGDAPIDQRRPDVLIYKKPSSTALAGFDLDFEIPKMAPGKYRLAAFRYDRNEVTYVPIGQEQNLEIGK